MTPAPLPAPPALDAPSIRTLRLFAVPPPIPEREGDELLDHGRPLAVFHGGRWHCAPVLRRGRLSDDL